MSPKNLYRLSYCTTYRFPIEFLFQAFGKMKDANEDAQKNAILNFYDIKAGPERVEHITVSRYFTYYY